MITLPTAAARIHALLAFHVPEEGRWRCASTSTASRTTSVARSILKTD
jgi:hypothetical protein